MQQFKVEKKLYLKSNNSVNKIFIRYLYCIILICLVFIGNLLIKEKYEILFSLLLNTIMPFGILLVIELLFNKPKNIKISDFLINNNIILYSIIIGLFTIKINLIVPMIAAVVTGIIKNINNKGEIGSIAYGLLIIICYKYLIQVNSPLINITNYKNISNFKLGDILFGLNYYSISPIIALLSFIYLFLKKSIKYNIFIYYILSFSMIMLFYGIFNKQGLDLLIYQLCSQNIIFMCIYLLCDYRSSPITIEGQAIYGTIIGLLTAILKFIMPILAIIIPIIIGPLFLTKPIDRLSIIIKSNRKLYGLIIFLGVFLVVTTSLVLNAVL